MQVCTAKLELGSFARVLYDWEGQQVTTLEDAPVLDQCLQNSPAPVLGPLWVSTGEGFLASGVYTFLSSIIKYTKAKRREALHYKKQVLSTECLNYDIITFLPYSLVSFS